MLACTLTCGLTGGPGQACGLQDSPNRWRDRPNVWVAPLPCQSLCLERGSQMSLPDNSQSTCLSWGGGGWGVTRPAHHAPHRRVQAQLCSEEGCWEYGYTLHHLHHPGLLGPSSLLTSPDSTAKISPVLFPVFPLPPCFGQVKGMAPSHPPSGWLQFQVVLGTRPSSLDGA